MIEIKIWPDEPLQKALSRFKKKCNTAGLTKEFRKRRFYEKPSANRRRLALKAQRNQQRSNGRFQKTRTR